MPTTQVEIAELSERLEEMLSLAAAGADVIVTQGTVPRARLVPLGPGQQRTPGLHPGALVASDDFDAPLPDSFWLGSP